jgi:NitT/TauT family transport system ATP-binding protein
VVVLSSRPAKIQDVLTIDIEHPRNLSSPRYLELRDQLAQKIGLAYSV